MSILSKQEYTKNIINSLRELNIDIQVEEDVDHPVIGDVGNLQLSYEQDDFSSYLAIGRMFYVDNMSDEDIYHKALTITNEIEDTLIYVKLIVVKKYEAIYAYTSIPLPMLTDLEYFLNYSSDVLERTEKLLKEKL